MTYLDQAFEDQKWQLVHREISVTSKKLTELPALKTYNFFRNQPLLVPSILWVIFAFLDQISYSGSHPDSKRTSSDYRAGGMSKAAKKENVQIPY